MLTKILDLALISMPDYKPPEDPALLKTSHQFDEPENRKNRRISRIPIPKLNFRLKPKVGSIVYCGLAANQLEHSGIYIGDNKIAHLDGSGKIEAVTPQVFLNRLNGFDSAKNIYISCKDDKSVGSRSVVTRARNKVGQKIRYGFITNNCHMFTSGCLTGEFDNNDAFFWLLNETTQRVLGTNQWLAWDIPSKG
jgi:hypothetical protein